MARYFIIIILFLFSCEAIEDPVRNNPLDPENPDYLGPQIDYISISDGEIINSDYVNITWEGSEIVSEYLYSLDDTIGGLEWKNFNTVGYSNLSEWDHVFKIQVRSEFGDTSETSIINFEVNAIQGPALMLYPQDLYIQYPGTATFEVIADDVENLAGVEFTLYCNSNLINITNIREGSAISTVEESFFFYEEVSSTQTHVIIAVMGENNPSISGSRLVLAEVTIESQGYFVDAPINLWYGKFRDPFNNEIEINETLSLTIHFGD